MIEKTAEISKRFKQKAWQKRAHFLNVNHRPLHQKGQKTCKNLQEILPTSTRKDHLFLKIGGEKFRRPFHSNRPQAKPLELRTLTK